MIETEEALVRRSRAGDPAAFEMLVRRCARNVYARLYLETGNGHRAEDLSQETFLLAWRRIGALDDPRQFRSWLNAIAHHVVIDAARRDLRKKRDGARVMSGDLTMMPDDSAPPDEQSDRREQRDRLLAILREMPEQYREPLMLRYLADADYDTIARQLALSNGSLRGLLQRGLKLLRERMSE